MKKILVFGLIACMFLTGCAARGGEKPGETQPPAAQGQAAAPAETPTGRTDGKREETFVFLNGALYIRDYERFTGDEEKYVHFADFAKLHTLTPAGEVRRADNNALPAEELCAYMAEVGDRLYTDETGTLYLRRSDDVLYAMKPAQE